MLTSQPPPLLSSSHRHHHHQGRQQPPAPLPPGALAPHLAPPTAARPHHSHTNGWVAPSPCAPQQHRAHAAAHYQHHLSPITPAHHHPADPRAATWPTTQPATLQHAQQRPHTPGHPATTATPAPHTPAGAGGALMAPAPIPPAAAAAAPAPPLHHMFRQHVAPAPRITDHFKAATAPPPAPQAGALTLQADRGGGGNGQRQQQQQQQQGGRRGGPTAAAAGQGGAGAGADLRLGVGIGSYRAALVGRWDKTTSVCPRCVCAGAAVAPPGAGVAAGGGGSGSLWGAPAWQTLPGTRFVVDLFMKQQAARVRGSNGLWVLTHFHADHYKVWGSFFGLGRVRWVGGQTRTWCGRLRRRLCMLKPQRWLSCKSENVPLPPRRA